MKVEIQLSMSLENENGTWNSFFQSRKKLKNKNRSLNFVFGNRRKTENANGISNFVFKCRRKTVGTRVHALFSSTCGVTFQFPSPLGGLNQVQIMLFSIIYN